VQQQNTVQIAEYLVAHDLLIENKRQQFRLSVFLFSLACLCFCSLSQKFWYRLHFPFLIIHSAVESSNVTVLILLYITEYLPESIPAMVMQDPGLSITSTYIFLVELV
jgi:hypothetical protein